jgi:hypothetical protein
MPTIDEVQSAIKSRLQQNFTAAPLRFQGDSSPLPDEPAPFIYVEMNIDSFGFIAYGGGRGQNLQRSEGELLAHVLVPIGESLDQGLQWAEQIAAIFRGQRVDNISYGAAEAMPASGSSEDGNYAYVASAAIELHFEKLG